MIIFNSIYKLHRRYYILLRIFKTYCFSAWPGCVGSGTNLFNQGPPRHRAHLAPANHSRYDRVQCTEPRHPRGWPPDMLNWKLHWKSLKDIVSFHISANLSGLRIFDDSLQAEKPLRHRPSGLLSALSAPTEREKELTYRYTFHDKVIIMCYLHLFAIFKYCPTFLCVFGWLMPGFA